MHAEHAQIVERVGDRVEAYAERVEAHRGKRCQKERDRPAERQRHVDVAREPHKSAEQHDRGDARQEEGREIVYERVRRAIGRVDDAQKGRDHPQRSHHHKRRAVPAQGLAGMRLGVGACGALVLARGVLPAVAKRQPCGSDRQHARDDELGDAVELHRQRDAVQRERDGEAAQDVELDLGVVAPREARSPHHAERRHADADGDAGEGEQRPVQIRPLEAHPQSDIARQRGDRAHDAPALAGSQLAGASKREADQGGNHLRRSAYHPQALDAERIALAGVDAGGEHGHVAPRQEERQADIARVE